MCYIIKIFFRTIFFVNFFNFWPRKFPMSFLYSAFNDMLFCLEDRRKICSQMSMSEKGKFLWPPCVLENIQESCLLSPQI